MKNKRFAGVLCVSSSYAGAVQSYRAAVQGTDVAFFRSESGQVYCSTSNADLFDPQNPNVLLEEAPELLEKATFASQSSADSDLRAHYTVCLDGCGAHIISDSSDNLTNCASCSASLVDIDEDRVREHIASQSTQLSESGVVAVGATEVAALEALRMSLANNMVCSTSSGALAATAGLNFDPYVGTPLDHDAETAIDSPESVQSMSSSLGSDDELTVHLYSCSGNCENPFTASTDEEAVFCASCSSPLVDMDAVSQSSDDDEYDEEDEEDDYSDFDDLDGLDDDFGDDEDDELDEDDIESLSSVMSRSASEDEDPEDEEFDESEFEELDEDELSESGVAFDEDDIEEDDPDVTLDEDDLDELAEDEDELMSESSSVAFSMLDALRAEGTLNPSEISLSRSFGKTPTVHMYYGDKPVAFATFTSLSNATSEESARNFFDSDNFSKVIATSCVEQGVNETIKDFGFIEHQVFVPVANALRDRITSESDARIAQATAEFDEACDSYRERYASAFGTALLGLSKSFWKDSSNPVAASISASMEAAGVRDARPIVDRAFVQHGGNLLSAAQAQAERLMEKSPEAQNQIAESIMHAAGIVAEPAPAPVAQAPVQQVQPQVIPQPVQQPVAQPHQTAVHSQSSASTMSWEDKLRCAFNK